MRIIIEPSNEADTSLPPNCLHHRVVIEHPSDDVGLDHVAFMVAQALIAFGYHEAHVKEYVQTR